MESRLYKQIRSQWRRPIYQAPNKPKMSNILRHIHLLQGKDVVDVGSNAGIITYEIAKHARSFVGVERDRHYFEQSLVTLRYISTPGRFVNMSLRHFALDEEIQYNAMFASCVLYHLSDDEIELIRTAMLPKCDVVLFISREDKRKGNNLYKWRNIVRFLQNSGMEAEAMNPKSNWTTVMGQWPK